MSTRNLRPSKGVNYAPKPSKAVNYAPKKHACGAPAPRISLLEEASMIAEDSSGHKTQNFSSNENLLFTTSGDRLPPVIWCSGCRDGGDLAVCTTCKIIGICSVCIDFGTKDGFVCPPCFKRAGKLVSYPWKFRSRGAGRENWPKMNTTPLAIISIHLEGMTDSPSILTYHHLAPYLHGNLVLVNLTFNFNKPRKHFNSQLENMLQEFEDGDFKEWTRFLVVITTHSVPESGDLHTAPNNKSAAPVDQLWAVLFPERFCNLLKREKRKNILNLLSCGALSSRPDSRDAVKGIAAKDLFDKILCFSQPNFQPSSTHKFVMDLALQNYVHDRIGLINVLREQQALGAHTDVVLFQPNAITTFRWTHPGARPMGNDTPASIQCPECSGFKTSPKSTRQQPSILKCEDCPWSATYTLPEGFRWCQGESPTNGLERGAWIQKVEKTEDKMEVS
ncbi:uncharacterized protein LACBIDRAFT_307567 [Laccaria bicolor S238N-H82]|uniref:Predicted protein n=1 Tax=Laccaria bicolor (strain S238N-H82 / ATCC MYA-4686) TaxID=486041 RepID=B0D1Z4_LACBS|nr:uncharacterized protein LACBIDRAFT_314277 [Laccaria bicolor S238N-H82]XP_001886244.1 uncharacterized protein LACBIDRAFT_307567 [Laccaria bicolor S238N-H82]EDR03103.1 predicted protein [Laccaria bicolor S238N-H82]EDR12078.1 predicted protein [Laccaria bicolor S238N-H82]|eukprot:XP_001877975.1 predicted protein [Laccaria bicolor S238N-H82]